MLHSSLEVAGGSSKVARGDYEEGIKGAGDLQADAVRCCTSTGPAGRRRNMMKMGCEAIMASHGTLGPIDNALDLSAAPPPRCAIPKFLDLLFVCASRQLKMTV